MDKTPLFCCLFSGLIPVSASAAPSSPPFPTQAEVAADASLYSPAMYLRRSDILLAVIIYVLAAASSNLSGETFLWRL